MSGKCLIDFQVFLCQTELSTGMFQIRPIVMSEGEGGTSLFAEFSDLRHAMTIYINVFLIALVFLTDR